MWYNAVEKETREMDDVSRTFTANIEMLNSMVVLMVGNNFEAHRLNFVSLGNTEEDMFHMGNLMDEVVAEIEKAVDENTLGLTIFNKESGCMPFIYLKEFSIPVLVHELVHATNHIIKFHGLANGSDHDELQAKMMEYLAKVFITAFDSNNKEKETK